MRTEGILAESWRSRFQTALLHLDLVEGEVADLPAEEEVGDDVEVVAQGEILEDGGDAEGPGCRRRGMVTVSPW